VKYTILDLAKRNSWGCPWTN